MTVKAAPRVCTAKTMDKTYHLDYAKGVGIVLVDRFPRHQHKMAQVWEILSVKHTTILLFGALNHIHTHGIPQI